MAARLESVAKYICTKAEWGVSNLKLQKVMYLTQMIYMGKKNGEIKLFDGVFQAWEYGPVEPYLYHKLKRSGSNAIDYEFPHAKLFKEDDRRRDTMDRVCDHFLPMSEWDLIDITHWEQGAWARNYMPGVRNVTIPDQDIVDEYKARISR